MMLKRALKIEGKKSIIELAKDKLPKPLDMIDDIVVVVLIVGYGYGQITGIPVFPEWTLAAAISYALGKDLSATK